MNIITINGIILKTVLWYAVGIEGDFVRRLDVVNQYTNTTKQIQFTRFDISENPVPKMTKKEIEAWILKEEEVPE